jgi:hypothetical protein
MKANLANGLTIPAGAAENAMLYASLHSKCSCQQCESAMSPRAYLVDLLDYALKHVKQDTDWIKLQYLADTFHQPFDRLPNSCSAVDESVRQARLVVEVLRGLLKQKVADQSDLVCSLLPYPAKFAVAGDVDGDGQAEVIVAPDWSYSWWSHTQFPGNGFWAMKLSS